MGDNMNTNEQRLGAAPPRAWVWPAAACVLAIGLAGRVWLTSLAPQHAYLTDHFDNIAMGLAAERHGLFEVYSIPLAEHPEVSGQRYAPDKGEFVPYTRRPMRITNYPPLGVTLFWLHSKLLYAIDADMQANTFAARLITSIGAVAGELVLAVVIFLLGRELMGWARGLIAASVCWLFPPLAMDSSFWGQTDSWALAPVAVLLLLLLRRRWIAAGVCLAVAVLLKPQGMFLAPIALIGAAIVPRAEAGKLGERTIIRAAKMVVAAGVAVAVISAPWTIANGMDWYEQSYAANFRMYSDTTLSAFNVWYLDALVNDGQLKFVLDSKAMLGPFTKVFLGKIAILAAMIALAVWCHKKYRLAPRWGLVIFSGLWLWSTFIWPTAVHERYIVYCMPIVILAAVRWRRLWPAVLALAVVGAAELSTSVWLKPQPAGRFLSKRQAQTLHQQVLQNYHRAAAANPRGIGPPPSRQQVFDFYVKQKQPRLPQYLDSRRAVKPWEYLLTSLSLLAYAWACAAMFFRVRPPPKAKAPPKVATTL